MGEFSLLRTYFNINQYPVRIEEEYEDNVNSLWQRMYARRIPVSRHLWDLPFTSHRTTRSNYIPESPATCL